MTDRPLFFLNAAGVGILSVLAAFQWSQNRDQHLVIMKQDKAMEAQETELVSSRKRVAGLEGDIERLQAALLDTQKAAAEASEAARLKTEDLAKVMAETTAEKAQPKPPSPELQAQVETWKKSLAERDESIKALNKQLGDTRERLDEAIKRLKK